MHINWSVKNGDRKCIKKHIMVFLETRYLGIQQLTMKNASAAENAPTTAHWAYTHPKRKTAKRGQS